MVAHVWLGQSGCYVKCTAPARLRQEATPGTLCPTGSGVAAPRVARRAKRGGARRDRTADLLHAMQALSQLSYGPVTFPRVLGDVRGSTLNITVQGLSQVSSSPPTSPMISVTSSSPSSSSAMKVESSSSSSSMVSSISISSSDSGTTALTLPVFSSASASSSGTNSSASAGSGVASAEAAAAAALARAAASARVRGGGIGAIGTTSPVYGEITGFLLRS